MLKPFCSRYSLPNHKVGRYIRTRIHPPPVERGVKGASCAWHTGTHCVGPSSIILVTQANKQAATTASKHHQTPPKRESHRQNHHHETLTPGSPSLGNGRREGPLAGANGASAANLPLPSPAPRAPEPSAVRDAAAWGRVCEGRVSGASGC